MKKKRVLSILMVQSLILASLAGCGGKAAGDGAPAASTESSESETEKSGETATAETDGADDQGTAQESVDPFGKYEDGLEIHFARQVDENMYDNALANLPGQSVEENMWLDTYKEEIGVQVVYDWYVKGRTEYEQKVNVTIASGELPDVMEVTASQMMQLADAGLIWDMTEVFDIVNLDKAADAFSVLQYSRFEIDDTEGIQLCGEEKFSYYTWNEGAAIVGVTDTERLEESLSNADPEVFFALLNEIKNKYCKSVRFTKASVYLVCASILLQALLNNLPKESDVCGQFDIRKLANYDLHKGFYDAMNFLETVADHYFRLRQNVKTDVKSQIVHQVNTFILEHISEDLSMVRLGELVGLHPVYLSRIYKEITGTLPGKYIMMQRVNEAKRLLTDSRMPIQTIAERTGLNTASYFSHYIKKHTGFTPQEIRNGAQ